MSARRELVDRFYASFDAADLDAARECFAPDVADAALATWREFTERVKGAAPDARLQVVSTIEEGDRIAVEGTLTGTFTAPMRTPKGEAPPSGNAFSLPFADVFTTADGRIVRHTVYFDQVEFLTQLGLLPAAA